MTRGLFVLALCLLLTDTGWERLEQLPGVFAPAGRPFLRGPRPTGCVRR